MYLIIVLRQSVKYKFKSYIMFKRILIKSIETIYQLCMFYLSWLFFRDSQLIVILYFVRSWQFPPRNEANFQ